MPEIQRQLASIRPISELILIPGADKVCLARVDDWKCVVSKEDFKVGDLCVFFEIDSHLPPGDARYDFLQRESREGTNGRIGPRIRTRKFFKGEYISQGLAMPLSLFPEIINPLPYDDVTEVLMVLKYEPILKSYNPSSSGTPRGNFPSFIPKTDQQRLENLRREYEDIWSKNYEVTVKRDGSSMTVYDATSYDRQGVCSRNLDLKIEEGGQFVEMEERYGLLQKIEGTDLALQGELFGPSIQQNPDGLKDRTFEVFDIYDIKTSTYLLPELRRVLCSTLEIQHVPVVYESISMSKFKDLADIHDAILADYPRTKEGWVFKATDGSYTFKVISPEYLAKQKD